MKKLILLILLICTLLSCGSNDDKSDPNTQNKVALLKIDYLTNAFEAGLEMEFLPNATFTIYSTYDPPGDFGSIQLYYQELDEKIFDGTIIWTGSGERSFPINLDQPSDFPTIDIGIPLPEISDFENVMYDEFAIYPDQIDYVDLWSSFNNLELVQNYRDSNPQGKINLFLYTPSVGFGNPAEWDWYVILKN